MNEPELIAADRLREAESQDPMREAFEHNRNVGYFLYEGAGPVENLPCTRAAIAGSLAGVVDAIEEEITTLNARKQLLEEELYKYKAAADLMLKQMTNEQN